MNIKIEFLAGQFVVNDKIGNLLLSRGFGTFQSNLYNGEGGLVLDPLEVMYIYFHKKHVFFSQYNFISKEHFLEEFNLKMEQFMIYEDLIHKGFYVKQALKFGAEFRIYDKHTSKNNNKDNSHHSTHLVFICNSRRKLSPQELFSINRVAHSTKKNIILAYVDPENSISYLEQRKWP
ncbi:MAG: tRNA-intron lyase [Nanoarchaeota archaeon]|nr:tRNA-intron lyase [Nanoarchaeota archaeon]